MSFSSDPRTFSSRFQYISAISCALVRERTGLLHCLHGELSTTQLAASMVKGTYCSISSLFPAVSGSNWLVMSLFLHLIDPSQVLIFRLDRNRNLTLNHGTNLITTRCSKVVASEGPFHKLDAFLDSDRRRPFSTWLR